MISIDKHNVEIQKNLKSWNEKPLLREIYKGFYYLILKWIREDLNGKTVELGSGIGNFKSVYPNCVSTDIFPNLWIDRVESAYKLSFKDGSLSNLILFDVFHHLAYPGSALKEFHRVLQKDGRVIIFEPYISLLGFVVYGILHHEPVALFDKIDWFYKEGKSPDKNYYAAQGNATRIFSNHSSFKKEIIKNWNIIYYKKYSALSYVLSGGFSKPSFYTIKMLPFVLKIERVMDVFPCLFATRVMVVLERK
jgi:SAM-dependent methyltransferase